MTKMIAFLVASFILLAGPCLAASPDGSPTNVTVNLGVPATQIKVYNPTSGLSPVQTLANASSVTVGLSDYPMVVEVVR